MIRTIRVLSTLQEALDRAEPGTIIRIGPGTYPSSGRLGCYSRQSGTREKPIVIEADGVAVIDGATTNRGLTINHDWNTIVGLQFQRCNYALRHQSAHLCLTQGVAVTDGTGVGFQWNVFSSHLRYEDCHASDLGSALSGANNGEGFYASSSVSNRQDGVPDVTGPTEVVGCSATRCKDGLDAKVDAVGLVVRDFIATECLQDGLVIACDSAYIDNVLTQRNGSNGIHIPVFTARHPVFGQNYSYGNHCVVRNVAANDNVKFGFNVKGQPVHADTSNAGSGNGLGLINGGYVFGEGVLA